MTFIMRLRTTLTGWQGAPGLATFYYRNETGTLPETAEAENAHSHVQAAWVAARELFPSIWHFSTDSIVDVLLAETGVLATQLVGGDTGGDVGTGSAAFGPAASGIVVRYNTADVVNGHVVRGRTFLSPIATGGDANATPTSAQLGLAGAFATALEGSGTPVISQIVWHRPVSGAGGQACDVVGHSVRDVFAVLTSRR